MIVLFYSVIKLCLLYTSYLGFTPNANGQYNPVYRLPLTKKALAIAEKLPTVKKVIIEPETLGGPMFS